MTSQYPLPFANLLLPGTHHIELPSLNPLKPIATVSTSTPQECDKNLVAFVGHIPSHVSDKQIVNLLQTCGNIRSWHRLNDPYGKPQSCGFVVYHDAIGLLYACKFIAGDEKLTGRNDNGLLLPNPNGSQSRLKVILDVIARRYCEIFRRTWRVFIHNLA